MKLINQKNNLFGPMSSLLIITCIAALSSAAVALGQTPIAQWTFEVSQPAKTGTAGTPNLITNIAAEYGSGTASGYHAGTYGTATYSTPAGNGTSHSFSANGWTTNPGAYF